MPTDEEMNLILKAAVLRAWCRELSEQTAKLTLSANGLEREQELARRLIQESWTSLQRIRLIHPEKDEPPASS
jgi:hypothetical protein